MNPKPLLERNEPKMREGIELFLEGLIGPQWRDDPNYIGTPARVAKAYIEMLSPAHNNWATFPSEESDLVVLRGHRIFGFCPHHLFPFEAQAYVGYIPHHKTIGISKLARVVEDHLDRPILQEDLTHAIATSLYRTLDAKGVGVVVAAVHGCMRCRGVRSDGDVVTSAMKGVLFTNPAARSEFLQIIGKP